MLNRLPYVIFHDELGDDLFKRYIKDKIGMTNTLVDLLMRRADSPLFDATGTPKKETRADAVREACGYAVDFLVKKFGKDTAGWKWTSLHRIEFSHVFGQEPMLRPFFNYGPFPFTGDEHTINRAGYANDDPFKVNITASIRYIVDFSAISKSLIVQSTGQTSHLLSAHRTDMSDLFMKGEYIPWYFVKEDYTAGSEGTLVLAPEK
jgi:penicillin amidase